MLFLRVLLRAWMSRWRDNSDERLMPKRRAAWSSWNYLGKSTEIAAAASKGHAAEVKPVFVTYWLNKVRGGKKNKKRRRLLMIASMAWSFLLCSVTSWVT